MPTLPLQPPPAASAIRTTVARVAGAATRLVDNRFYDIWAVGEDGCIIMKPQRPWVPFE